MTRDLSKWLFSFFVDDLLKRRRSQETPAAHRLDLRDRASALFQGDTVESSVDRLANECTDGRAATFRLSLETVSLGSAHKHL
ncbi:MAG: hypothetical protein M3P38_10875 [Chloroflexota bacterium]|nr:hypothetical protein [Chloroflexota bacterium]